MGTRHLICIVQDSEFKLANYGQWDGYPSGQGENILKFLKKEFNIDSFKDKVKSLKTITPEELDSVYVECGAKPKSQFISMDVSDKVNKKYPQLTRECGSNIFSLIQNSPNGLLIRESAIDFATDGSCEWAYVVDLDKQKFEVFTWLNNEQLKPGDRFFSLKDKQNTAIQLVKAFDLNKLPSKNKFLLDIDKIVSPEDYPEIKEKKANKPKFK